MKNSASQKQGGETKASAGFDFCGVSGCKSGTCRFGFCSEHFEHYKFGLINKGGEKVPDFDKKIDHYEAYLRRKSGRKVA